MSDITENVIQFLTNEYLQNEQRSHNVREFFTSCDTYQLFGNQKGGESPEVIGHINGCLNTSKTRVEGLLLLSNVLDQCGTEVFSENVESWAKSLLQILEGYNTTLVHQMACSTLSTLLKYAKSLSAVFRQLASILIPGLIPTLLNAEPAWEEASMKCLKVTMEHFSGPCSQFGKRIENKILDGLGHCPWDGVLCGVLGECYALLSSCGGGGDKKIDKATVWAQNTNRLIDMLHSALDRIFVDLESDREIFTANRNPSSSMTDYEASDMPSLVNRYKVCCTILGAQLRKELSVHVLVPVEDILGVVCRALAISPKFLMVKPTHERMLLCSVLPSIHQKSLHILESLITCVQKDLIVHGPLINKLIIQVLNHSSAGSEGHSGQKKIFSALRTALYKLVITWVTVAGAASGIDTIDNDLTQHTITDAKPQIDTVKLRGKTTNKLAIVDQVFRKKKKNSAKYENSSSMSWQQKSGTSADWELCTSALEVMRVVLLNSGPLLRPTNHQAIQELLIPVLLEMDQVKAAPYTHPSCRAAIYGVLHACVLSPHPKWPPPTQIALQIFSRGQNTEESLELRRKCQEYLVMCRCIIHPRVPPLVSPISITDPIVLKTTVNLPAPEPVTRSIAEGEPDAQNGEVVLEVLSREEAGLESEDQMEEEEEEDGAYVEISSSSMDSDVMITTVSGEDDSVDETQDCSGELEGDDDDIQGDDVLDSDDLLSSLLERPEGDVLGDQGAKASNTTDYTEGSQEAGEVVTLRTTEDSCKEAWTENTTQGTKRTSDMAKISSTEEPPPKKMPDGTCLMLETFVDAGPDSD